MKRKLIPSIPIFKRTPKSVKQDNIGTLEYEETRSAPLLVRILIYSFFTLLIGFFLLYPLIDHEAYDSLNLFLCLTFAFVFWFIHIFLSLKVRISSRGIQFGFYLFSKKFAYKDILNCMVFRYQFTDYFGWGIRKGPDGSTIYNVIGDQQLAVKITVQENDVRKEYAFSAKRPEVICKKIQAHVPKAPVAVPTKK